MKVSLSPDVILYGWLGLKHRLTNLLQVIKVHPAEPNAFFIRWL